MQNDGQHPRQNSERSPSPPVFLASPSLDPNRNPTKLTPITSHAPIGPGTIRQRAASWKHIGTSHLTFAALHKRNCAATVGDGRALVQQTQTVPSPSFFPTPMSSKPIRPYVRQQRWSKNMSPPTPPHSPPTAGTRKRRADPLSQALLVSIRHIPSLSVFLPRQTTITPEQAGMQGGGRGDREKGSRGPPPSPFSPIAQHPRHSMQDQPSFITCTFR